MGKCQKVFKGILFTVLFLMLLLFRGIRKGLYVVLFRWCSWQIGAVGVILVLLLLGLVIWNGIRTTKRKIILTCLLVLLTLLLIPIGRFLDPFSYEVHPVQVEAGGEIVLFRPTGLKGHMYNIGRKGVLVKIAPKDYPVSTYGHFSPDLYEVTAEGEELVFRVRNEERTECEKCPDNCIDCENTNGKCNKCQSGYGLKDNKCTQCQKGYYSDFTTNNTCIKCPKGYYSSNTKSIRCEKCYGNTYSDDEGLSQCKECDSSCKTCDNTNGNCLTCKNGYKIKGGS